MGKLQDEITLHVGSDEFFFSAVELERSPNSNKVGTASYYLYGHSLELALKSYLHTKGESIETLKKLGHNLEGLLNKCISHGIKESLDIDDDYIRVVKGINRYYSTKEFEYMTRTMKSYPRLYDVKAVVKKTINLNFNIIFPV